MHPYHCIDVITVGPSSASHVVILLVKKYPQFKIVNLDRLDCTYFTEETFKGVLSTYMQTVLVSKTWMLSRIVPIISLSGAISAPQI
jgi:hypothetical protein